MRKLILFFLQFIFIISYSQDNFSVANISGLMFHKNAAINYSENDTIENHVMNFNYIKDTLKVPFLKKSSSRLTQATIFLVSNKFGGQQKKIYAKVGSSLITNKGVYDIADSLMISNPQETSKIVTFSKSDNDKKISSGIFLPNNRDKKLLIPEIFVFNKILSPIDRQKIETYLSIKYGITINDVSENNYISSANDVIWDSKKNKNFNGRVTGIGRDDAFNLYQKQSKNFNDQNIVMSVDSLQILNNKCRLPIFSTNQK